MAFGFYKTFTTDHTQAGASDSTNFPVTVWRTDADLATVANGGKAQNSSGFDIRPYSDSGLTSALTYELVSYNATTGALEMHVKVATLSHTVDLVSYMAVGDSGISTDGSSSATWSAYLSVWHAQENAANTTVADATGTNAGTLQANTSTKTTTGEIGNAFTYNGSSDYYSVTDTLALRLLGNYTVSAWIKPTTLKNVGNIYQKFDGGFSNSWGLATFLDGHWAWQLGGQTDVASASSALANGTWARVAARFDGTNVNIYTNTTNVSAARSAAGSNTLTLHVGADLQFTRYFNGVIDEARIAASDLGAAWQTAEYNNQVASSTFLTWGSITATGGGGGTRGLFWTPPLNGLGGGGSFFRDPLAAPMHAQIAA